MKKDLEKIFFTVRKNFIWTADDTRELSYKGQTLSLADDWKLMQPNAHGILKGDCEDFCLYCSKVIKEQLNIPKSQRLLTYCKTESGEGHMILVVNDTMGDQQNEYVLDNRQRRISTLRKLKRSGYRDFARPEGPVNGPWHMI